jgi:hypothetical protein
VNAALQEGDAVRFSPAGITKVRSMPEAWGLHTALTRGELGEVVQVYEAEGDLPAQLSVEFPSGGAYNWDAECFELAPPDSRKDR